MVLRVMPEHIPMLWNQLEPLIASALSRVPTHNTDDLKKCLMNQSAHLWVDMDGPRVTSLIVTEFAVRPRGTWLHVWISAAVPDVPMDWPAYLDVAEKFRKQTDCCGFQFTGRRGWMKRLPIRLDGISEEGTTYRWTENFDG